MESVILFVRGVPIPYIYGSLTSLPYSTVKPASTLVIDLYADRVLQDDKIGRLSESVSSLVNGLSFFYRSNCCSPNTFV